MIKHVHPSLCKQTSSNLSYLFIFFSIIVQLSQVYPIFQPLLLNSHHGRSPVTGHRDQETPAEARPGPACWLEARSPPWQWSCAGGHIYPSIQIHLCIACESIISICLVGYVWIRHMRNVIMNLYDSYIDASYCEYCVLIVYWLYNSGHWDIQNMTSLGSCLEPAAAEAAATSKSTCWSMRAYQVELMVLLA